MEFSVNIINKIKQTLSVLTDTPFCTIYLSKESRCIYVLLQYRFKRKSCALQKLPSHPQYQRGKLTIFRQYRGLVMENKKILISVFVLSLISLILRIIDLVLTLIK